jgi:DNA-binding beta-propeller fold protein YncE
MAKIQTMFKKIRSILTATDDRFDYGCIEVSSFAGLGVAGYEDGSGLAARFNLPQGIAVDPAGNVYVADSCNNRIRKISGQGMVSTLGGRGKVRPEGWYRECFAFQLSRRNSPGCSRESLCS